MKELYEAILARLQDQAPELKYIDLDKGQLEFEKPPVVYPCALIGIQLPNIEQLSRYKQRCSALVTIRLATDKVAATASSTPAAQRLEALAYFDLETKVFKALQGFKTANLHSELERQTVREERRPGLKVIAVPYSTEYFEDIS